MPSQNRPVVKDGRLVVKKRTDRSYLKPAPSAQDAEAALPETEPDSPVAPDESLPETVNDTAAEPTAAFAPPPTAPVVAATPATGAKPAPRSSTARALEQQGVRKRREVDLDAVAKRDSRYAVHELRRIAILTAIVIVALIILTLTLR